LRQIGAILHVNNPFVKIYENAANLLNNDPKFDFKIVIHQDTNVQQRFDKRRYNKPSTNDIAAIVTGEESDTLNTNRQINVYKKNPSGDSRPHIIRDDHTAYDPLHYVLMHIYGEHG
jgi:hypothetical protein